MTFKKITKLPIELKSLNLKEVEPAISIAEDAELSEAKRYVRRYYMKPQNIFCSNKTDILTALIDINDQDSTIYTLNNLGDIKDVSKLGTKDIIYYYRDGILYDKNNVKIMDYDLSVKHEEERKKFGQNIEAVSDAEFSKVYDDRITDMTKTDDVKENLEEAALEESTETPILQYISQNDINYIVNKALDNLGEVKAKAYITPSFSIGNNAGGSVTEISYDNGSLICTYKYTDYSGTSTKSLDIDHLIDSINTSKDTYFAYDTFSKKAKKILKEIRKEAIALNKLQTPNIKIRRDDDAFKKLTPEIANELKKHITDLTFSVPGEDVSWVYSLSDADKQYKDKEETLGEIASEKLQSLKASFDEQPFADKAYEAGIVSERSGGDTIQNIITSWGIIGRIKLNCSFADLSENTKEYLNQVKVGADYIDETKKEIDDYRAIKALLRFFNNDIYFYEKKDDTKDDTTAEIEKPADEKHELDLDFPDINAYGDKVECLHESKEEICCICGEPIVGYGNNPEPYKHDGRCCDACNLKFVIPARLEMSNKERD